ncbi:hypothetical protein CNR22_23755 [Sphingobacteriaceae bacterium]|nr:hypothetical protein CNR22_23755 [Sphingobacteriaceae bacterium]
MTLLIFIFAFVVLGIFFLIRKKIPFFIKAKTIRLQKPGTKGSERTGVPATLETKNLINLEKNLRAVAYKKTSIKTGPDFFDDSDMQSDYYLVIVYDKKTNTPLLTARYYFEKEAILKCLQGDENGTLALNPYLYNENELFLSDRLSGNTSSKIYRRYRNYIFLLFYKEIIRRNNCCKFILMARKQPQEKLLSKYLRLGLDVKGSNVHKGKAHWILLGDLKKIKRSFTQTLFSTLYLLVKT